MSYKYWLINEVIKSAKLGASLGKEIYNVCLEQSHTPGLAVNHKYN